MATLLSLYDLFAEIPVVYPLYFFYGAAFLFLGIAIAVKELRASDLRLSGSLWMLAAFGFIHGLYEWLHLLPFILGERLTGQELFLVRLILLAMMALSYLFLLQFGLSLIGAFDSGGLRWIRSIPSLLAVAGAIGLARIATTVDLPLIGQTEIFVRYTLGLMSGLVTGYGLIVCAREIHAISGPVARNFRFSGIAILVYALLAGIVDARTLLAIIALPVELLRGTTIALFAYFIIKALNIFDIETRQKIEQQTRILAQTEKLSSLGQLAAGIAHEINNPLTNASLGIQTLKSRMQGCGDPHGIVPKLAAIEKNIDRASTIAQELLQFSRQRETGFVPLDLNEILAGALTLLGYRVNGVRIEQDLAPLPPVMGESGKLKQLFINLVANSLEAMPDGGVIRISTAGQDGLVEIRISDTGHGIAQQDLNRVFDPFFTTKEIGSGTGLGLSISYGIVRQHRGQIALKSAIGRGTTAIVQFPTRERYEKDTACG